MPRSLPGLVDGWLCVPYDGADTSVVALDLGGPPVPAFLDYVDGIRVAKVRPAAAGVALGGGALTATVLVDGVPTTQHRVTT